MLSSWSKQIWIKESNVEFAGGLDLQNSWLENEKKWLMKENMSPNVLTYVKSATQSKKALVLGFLNQAMPENPLKNQLKNTDLSVLP